ncbi:MAG: hypothetical protein CMB48_04900 [Euryarchaeota archaeon]|nr:hypothetical protein [Euryarchaeota archaeon]MBL01674.1 hypothetical protein [Chloroflexota bacterium]|tara:strand:+ start:1474 stop:2706 length:1233 start_codon:yes stop_codon:yes gene_type:complete
MINKTKLSILLVILFTIFFSGCMNDLSPQGGWADPLLDDEKIIIPTKKGEFVQFDINTNSVNRNWGYKNNVSVGSTYSSPISLGNGLIGTAYSCRGDDCEGQIYKINKNSGLLLWGEDGYQLKTKLIGPIAKLDNDKIYVSTSSISDTNNSDQGYLFEFILDDNYLYESWRLPLSGASWGGVLINESIAYVPTMSGHLYAIDLSSDENYINPDDRILWTFDSKGAIYTSLYIKGDYIYFGDFSNTFYRLNISNNKRNSVTGLDSSLGEWEKKLDSWIGTPAIIEDESLFVFSLAGDIYSLKVDSGETIWKTKIPDGQIVSSPVLFNRSRGTVTERSLAIPSSEKNVYIISVLDGRELGIFITEDSVVSSPIYHDDRIYLQTNNNEFKWFSTISTNLEGCVDLNSGGFCDD